MLYEIHMLKNYPPVNLNRDDTGAPKTCMFGGVTRSRISSQCLKRSWRTSKLLKAELGEDCFGVRTRKLPSLVEERLLAMGVDNDYAHLASMRVAEIGKNEKDNKKASKNEDADSKTKSKANNTKKDEEFKTKQLIFYSPEDIDAVALLLKDVIDSCRSLDDVKKISAKELEKTLYKKDANIGKITLDIALFGRMVTSDAFHNVEASMQVAHAISTGKVSVESDYFTAMDDLLAGGTMEETGAGMINDTDYNASCYYLYASLDTDALKENLSYTPNAEELVQKLIPALLRTIAFTNPSGKQNSFAGHVLPSAVMVECKEVKIPTSMVNAFAEPVKGTGIVEQSIRKLAEEADMTARDYGLPVTERLWFCVDKYKVAPETATQVCSTFSQLVEAAASALK